MPVAARPPPTLPTLALLDNFNRGNATTLGGNWSQTVLFGSASIRVNSQQASDVLPIIPAQAIWNGANGAGATFGAKQGAAFTYANATALGGGLFLKASGGSPSIPASFIRVRYNAGAGQVQSTTNSGLSYSPISSFPARSCRGTR